MNTFVIDLNNNNNNNLIIPEHYKRLIIKNITDNNFNKFIIPEHFDDIELYGSLSELIIPEHVKIMECYKMGLKKIICNDKLEHIYCSFNELEFIELPDNIIAVDVTDNKIKNIKPKNKFNKLMFLDLERNMISDFDLELPKSMSRFNISGNPNIKIKYIRFIFGISELSNIIDGDYDEILFGGNLMYNEYLRGRLEYLCDEGKEYITLEQLQDDEFFNL